MYLSLSRYNLIYAKSFWVKIVMKMMPEQQIASSESFYKGQKL